MAHLGTWQDPNPPIVGQNELNCGLCGLVLPSRNHPTRANWARYYRAVYCVGPDTENPQLSGVGFFDVDAAVKSKRVPSETHQRFDDDESLVSFVTIRGVHAPDYVLDRERHGLIEREDYAWGFTFHDSCWINLQQAVAPDPINIKSLWRILISVPAGSGLPNWGHDFEGTYRGPRRKKLGHSLRFDQDSAEDGTRFPRPLPGLYEVYEQDGWRCNRRVFLEDHLQWIVPSTQTDPLRLDTIFSLIKKLRLDPNATGPPSVRPPQSSEGDVFAKLPVEICHLILTMVDSKNISSFRLASRAIASAGLPQSFWQSRFCQGRELEYFFDGFLLNPSERAGLDWESLYRTMMTHLNLRWDNMDMGELHRFRLWWRTICPLRNTINMVSQIEPVRHGINVSQTDEDDRINKKDSDEWNMCMAQWRDLVLREAGAYDAYGSGNPTWRNLERNAFYSEITLPKTETKDLHVTFITFFGVWYITGLRFIQTDGEEVSIGYVLKRREVYIPVEGAIAGFFVAVDEFAVRSVGVATDANQSPSDNMPWAGEREDLKVRTLMFSVDSKHRLFETAHGDRTVRCSFDSIRMTGLGVRGMQEDDTDESGDEFLDDEGSEMASDSEMTSDSEDYETMSDED